MTNEQIKQNAEQYAINGNTRDSLSLEILFQNTRDAFIEGAHSRDEEIEQWKESKRKLRLRLMQRIHELRNPWISVEERLPERHTPVYANNKAWFFALRTDNKQRPWYNMVGRCGEKVTHWKPIPELKKGE